MNDLMKTLTLLFLSLMSLAPLAAQSAGELLDKMEAALEEERNDYAVSLFRQAAHGSLSQTEMFYWTRMDKNHPILPRLAKELATQYKKALNYDKAYLFYREYLQHYPNEVSALADCAEMEMMRGREKQAADLYERVLKQDANNLKANIFLGNYYYLQAERHQKQLDTNFKKLASPTRMQYARYREALLELLTTDYYKAKEYLQRVMTRFPSVEASSTLEKITHLEAEIR